MDINLETLGASDLTPDEAGYLFALYTGLRDGTDPEYAIRPSAGGVPRIRIDASLQPDDVTILLFMYGQQKAREAASDGLEQRSAAKAVAAYNRFKSTGPDGIRQRLPIPEEEMKELQRRRTAGDAAAFDSLMDAAKAVYVTFLDDVDSQERG